MAYERRLWSRVPEETDKEVDRMAKAMGITRSALIAECVVLGMRQLKRVVFPEEYIGDDHLVALMKRVIQEDESLKEKVDHLE